MIINLRVIVLKLLVASQPVKMAAGEVFLGQPRVSLNLPPEVRQTEDMLGLRKDYRKSSE